MKLYEVPEHKGLKVRLLGAAGHPPAHREFDENEVVTFNNCDGMYSHCIDANGYIVHLPAWTEVEIVE